MKIAVDIRHLASPNQAGVGYYTICLIRELAACSPDDHFLLFASGTKKTLSYLPPFDIPNVTVVTKAFPNRLLFFLFVLRLRTMESFLPEPPDLWLLPNHNITHTNLPYILTVHDLSFDIFPSFFTIKDRLRYRIGQVKRQTKHASHLLAVSESTKRDLTLRWGIAPENITVTPLGVDRHITAHEKPSDRSFLARYGITTGGAQAHSYILCLCTREPRKNIEAIIQAYEQWQPIEKPDLVIAGGRGWKSKELDRLISASPAREQIRVIGYVHNEHKPAFLRHAQAFLFPSFYEGFGLPAQEALACRKTIIAGATGSLPEVLNKNVILVDPFNVTDLVQALEQMNTHTVSSTDIPSWKDTARKTHDVLTNHF